MYNRDRPSICSNSSCTVYYYGSQCNSSESVAHVVRKEAGCRRGRHSWTCEGRHHSEAQLRSVRDSVQSFEAESRCQKFVGEEKGEFKAEDRTENKSILKAVVQVLNEQ